MDREYKPVYTSLMEIPEKCGVYQIKNKVNGKLYVGSSKNMHYRLRKHFEHLRANKHENRKLQNAYNKYGKDNFIISVIELCEEDKQYIIEQYWIDRFIGDNCYNINPCATQPPDCSGKKYIFSDEHKMNLSKALKKTYQENPYLKEQMRLARIGKNMGAEHVNSKAVVCLETGIKYGGISEAARLTGATRNGISACCRHVEHTANGFHWLFEDEYNKHTSEEIELIILTDQAERSPQVVCLETKKAYKNILSATADTGADRNVIVDCCNKIAKTAGGLHWVYLSEYNNMTDKEIQDILKEQPGRKRKCKCLETGQVFNTIGEAVKELNAPKVSEVCSGKRKTTNGLHFEYVD